MEPYKASKLPIDYKIDSKYFLDSVLLNESYKSTQIEGTQISQDEMYYLKYMEKTDDNREIQNLKHTIEFAYANICEGKEIYREDMKKIEVIKGSSRRIRSFVQRGF